MHADMHSHTFLLLPMRKSKKPGFAYCASYTRCCQNCTQSVHCVFLLALALPADAAPLAGLAGAAEAAALGAAAAAGFASPLADAFGAAAVLDDDLASALPLFALLLTGEGPLEEAGDPLEGTAGADWGS